jgi:CRP/FNR family cyclic AMP-dependent transcriptional regulator
VARSSMEDTEFRVRSQYQRTLEPGETLFDAGEAGDKLYVIQSGEVELTRQGPSGHRVVAHLGAGDFLGELCIVAGRHHTTRAVALNTTRVLELDRETLEAMCLAQPEIAIRLVRVLASRLIEAEARLAALGVDDLLQPVVRTLVRQAVPAETGVRIETNLRRVAEAAGLSMLGAHRALHQLFDRKVLRLVDDQLLAPDLAALAACLEE